MAIHPNEINFYREQQKIIADNRARAQQKIHDFETFRQRQREQKFWAERAAYVKRVTTPPKASKPEPRVLVPGRAATVFVPDESQQDASSKEPGALLHGLCRGFPSAHSWVRHHGSYVGLRRYSRYALALCVSVQPRLDKPRRRVRTLRQSRGVGHLRHRVSRAVPRGEMDCGENSFLHGVVAGPPRRIA